MEVSQNTSPTNLPFDFLHAIEALKNIPRRGWVLRGVPEPESVSDHMYRMTVTIWMIPEIDDATKTRAIKMALAHDMGEAIIGDIAPSDGVPGDEKYLKERLALNYLSCLAKPVNPSFADEIVELWSEFEDGESQAAKLVRDVDSLECMDQAVIYEERLHLNQSLGEFMDLGSDIKLPKLREWASQLIEQRKALWSSTRDVAEHIVFVLGGPGVGKGTQCTRAAQEFSSVHISAGDLLREEANSPSSVFGDFINESMKNSVIVPPELSVRLVGDKMKEMKREGNFIYLLDGFPRSLDQLRAFEKKINQRYYTILLDCSEEVLLRRLRGRSGASTRIDDNEDSIKKRLRTFTTENSDLIDHLRKGGPIWTIDANGSMEDVFVSVKILLKGILQSGR